MPLPNITIFSIVDPKGVHISVTFKTQDAAQAYLDARYPSCPCGTIKNQGYGIKPLTLKLEESRR